MMTRFVSIAALVLSTFAAQAATLNVGSNALTGTTSAAEPQLVGLVILEDELTPVSFSLDGGTYSANVQSRVVRAVDGTLDFYWRVRDTTYDVIVPTLVAAGALGNFRIGEFGPVIGLNSNFRTDGLGDVGPDTALVFGAPFDNGYVNFEFSNGLAAGLESYFIFIDTDATDYVKTAVFDLANLSTTQISASFPTFRPLAPVPEPATLSLLISGLGLFGVTAAALRRRS